MILVVGATGQLGTAIVRKLAAQRGTERPIRAFVRPTANYRHLLEVPGVELAFGDLRAPESIEAACEGVETVVATANGTAPRDGSRFEPVEDDGYAELIDACERRGVERFVFVSVPVTPLDERVPTFRNKRLIEQRLEASELTYTVVRADAFMDVWLALPGSSIPLRGAELPTLDRPFWFTRLFRRATEHLIEARGIALIPGSGDTRHAFVALDDVAALTAACVDSPAVANATVEIGGPEALSWDDVVEIYSEVLERGVYAVHTPARVYRLQQQLLGRLSDAAGNVMGLNWIMATVDTSYEPRRAEQLLGRPLTTVEEFLRERAALPPTRMGTVLSPPTPA